MRYSNVPDPSDSVIDSREVISRMEELQDERVELVDFHAENKELQEQVDMLQAMGYSFNDGGVLRTQFNGTEGDLKAWDDENGEELQALEDLNEEGEQNASDWRYGATLIAEEHFTDWVEQDLQDMGELDIPDYIVIDWEATANNLKADYTEVSFDGNTFLVRSC